MHTDYHSTAPSVTVVGAESNRGCCNICLYACLKLSNFSFLQYFPMLFPILKLAWEVTLWIWAPPTPAARDSVNSHKQNFSSSQQSYDCCLYSYTHKSKYGNTTAGLSHAIHCKFKALHVNILIVYVLPPKSSESLILLKQWFLILAFTLKQTCDFVFLSCVSKFLSVWKSIKHIYWA